MNSRVASRRFAGLNAPASWHARAEAFAWLLPTLAFGAIAARRWVQMGPYVTGGDPGNWFALGKELFGQPGKSTVGAFPPLVPATMHLGQLVLDEMVVAKSMAAISVLLIIVATYFVTRQSTNVVIATSVASIVGLSSYLNEVSAFGGYPQNIATALIIFAAAFVARYLEHGRRNDLIKAAVATSLVGLTHHAYFFVAGVICGTVWLIWLTQRPSRPLLLERTKGLAIVAVSAALAFLPTLLLLARADYAPPLNVLEADLASLWTYSAAEAPWFWLWLTVAGLVYLLLTTDRRNEATWKVGAACALVGIVAYVWSGEARVFPPIVIGSSIGTGLALHSILSSSQSSVWRLPTAVLLAAFVLVLWARTDVRMGDVYSYYRVADGSLMETASWIDQRRDEGTFVARHGRNIWPIGWWFEGLTEARVVVGGDERLLAFPEERANARLAAQFFDRDATSERIDQLTAETGARYLVIRVSEWPAWEGWFERVQPSVEVAFDNDDFMIFRVRSAG